MGNVTMTMTVDTSQLEREVFPALLAYGRRTLQEQCVTSATFIALRAQRGTVAATSGQIDEDMEVLTTPVLSTRGKRKGLPLRTGRKSVSLGRSTEEGREVPLAVLIAQSRVMQPFGDESRFNNLTGFRWAIMQSPFKGVSRAQGAIAMMNLISRMVNARHSSTNFLQSGWTPAIRAGLSSGYYRYNPLFGSRREARALPNSRNTLKAEGVGDMVIELSADDCVVTTSNDVGEPEGRSNATLAARHREALIAYGTEPLEKAIAQEISDGQAELERRVKLGWKVKYPQW